jgi:cation:H+ antiporter
LAYVQIAIGFALLFGGGELMIRGSVNLARRLGVSPLLVGATVVAFGTSAPELAVSVRSVVTGHGDLAIGSVIGSNVANVLLILATAALVDPVVWSRRAVLRDGTGLAVASVVFTIIAATGGISRWEGALMLGLLVLLTGVSYWRDRRRQAFTLQVLEAEAGELEPSTPGSSKPLVLTLFGIVAIVVGADQLVAGATVVARAYGISEATIGLTLVAIGTSLPELATCLVAAYRKHSDVALGNVVGSNVFNMLGIGGTAALVSPLPIPSEILYFDLWVMLAVMLATGALLVGVGRLSRIPATFFLLAYVVWIVGKA